ncbi:hypothetical protein BaOVIS_030100 [Babesia ovis]|uniref:Uncharacterized protein n=1 Tax=Babesia ovis TaxID=5869 RepID=A0A9W5TDA3_BABOV|nr:hypothetical protein BaOVIS_030100 [Babesia ovis]
MENREGEEAKASDAVPVNAPLSLGERLLAKSSKKTGISVSVHGIAISITNQSRAAGSAWKSDVRGAVTKSAEKAVDEASFPGLQAGTSDTKLLKDPFRSKNEETLTQTKDRWKTSRSLLDSDMMGENFLMPGMKGTYPLGYRNFIGRGTSENPPPPPSTPPPAPKVPKASTSTTATASPSPSGPKWRREAKKSSESTPLSTRTLSTDSLISPVVPNEVRVGKKTGKFQPRRSIDKGSGNSPAERTPDNTVTEQSHSYGHKFMGLGKRNENKTKAQEDHKKKTGQTTKECENADSSAAVEKDRIMTHNISSLTVVTPPQEQSENETPVTPKAKNKMKFRQNRTQWTPTSKMGSEQHSSQSKFTRAVQNASLSDSSDGEDAVEKITDRFSALGTDSGSSEFRGGQTNTHEERRKYRYRRKYYGQHHKGGESKV